MRHDSNGIDIRPNSWTLSVWAKDLLPPLSSGRSTLFRGQGKQSNRDWDRYLVVRGSNRLLHTFDGADGNANNRYRSSGKEIDPVALRGWHHFVIVGIGNRTRFFLDGVFAGEADRQEQSDVFYIGNSSDNELFAEFLDDVRIYGVSLNDVEAKAIYGGGFGDQFTSVLIDDNSSVDSLPRTFSINFGKDSQNEAVSGLISADWSVTSGTIDEVNATGAVGSYLLTVDPNATVRNYSLSLPAGGKQDDSGAFVEAFRYDF